MPETLTTVITFFEILKNWNNGGLLISWYCELSIWLNVDRVHALKIR